MAAIDCDCVILSVVMLTHCICTRELYEQYDHYFTGEWSERACLRDVGACGRHLQLVAGCPFACIYGCLVSTADKARFCSAAHRVLLVALAATQASSPPSFTSSRLRRHSLSPTSQRGRCFLLLSSRAVFSPSLAVTHRSCCLSSIFTPTFGSLSRCYLCKCLPTCPRKHSQPSSVGEGWFEDLSSSRTQATNLTTMIM